MTFSKITLNSPLTILPVIMLTLTACQQQEQITTTNNLNVSTQVITLSNTLGNNRTEESLTLPFSQLITLPHSARYLVKENNSEIPSQAIDSNGDGKLDSLLVNVKVESNSTTQLQLSTTLKVNDSYIKRTHAEVSVFKDDKFVSVDFEQMPKTHTIGDGLYRYEGTGWESDKIAYRLYFDERNVIDIFGKKSK